MKRETSQSLPSRANRLETLVEEIMNTFYLDRPEALAMAGRTVAWELLIAALAGGLVPETAQQVA